MTGASRRARRPPCLSWPEYSRRNPGKINYTGLGGQQSRVAASTNQRLGSDMFFVPYKGAAEAFQAFLAGTCKVIYVAIGYPGLIANINSGKWKAWRRRRKRNSLAAQRADL